MSRIIRYLSVILTSAIIICSMCSFDSSDTTSNLVFSYRKNDKMMIALTFDDGPHPKYTPEILDILKKYGVCATFFVVGENAVCYPDIIERCRAEGHEVANHTYSHRDLSKDSFNDICREVQNAENTVYETIESRTKLLRPPGGSYGKNVIKAAAEMDYTLVLWNIDTRDWAHTPAKQIASKVLGKISPGDIVLMHDFIGKDSPTPNALKIMIPALLKEGYRFVTVSELLGCK